MSDVIVKSFNQVWQDRETNDMIVPPESIRGHSHDLFHLQRDYKNTFTKLALFGHNSTSGQSVVLMKLPKMVLV